MSVNLDGTVRYNSDTGNIELEELGVIIPISEDWYKNNVYLCQPESSSHTPTTAAPLHGIQLAFEVIYVLYGLRIIGTLKMRQFIEVINKTAEVIGGV